MSNEMMVQGANRFMFYIWNYKSKPSPLDGVYYPEAILGTKWNCSLEHICSKWTMCCERAEHDTANAMVKFYGELDGENRRQFLEWIMSNYSDEQSI